MNRKETHEANGVDRPRPMRRNPLLTLMLGGTGFALSVSAGQCRSVNTDWSPYVDEPEVLWPVGAETTEILGDMPQSYIDEWTVSALRS